MKYSDTRSYGINHILREYARYPWYLPLPCHMEHGWTPLDEALVSDLKTTKPLMMVFSRRRLQAWQRKSQIPAAIMGSPLILYRKTHHITKQATATGTVAFPSHSTYDLQSRFDISKYCQELKNLPSEFQPVTVCLFWLDYIDKTADIYRQSGFKVVTAGHKLSNSLEFARRHYEILSTHKYATSNEVGTYAFHSVDLGIPFFITGQEPVLLNVGGDVNVGHDVRLDDFELGTKVMRLFSTGPRTSITQEQEEFVSREVGASDHLGREEMHNLLYHHLTSKGYYLRAFFPFILDTILSGLIFNAPWTRLLIRARKSLVKT
jgi:hypothetical protein